MSTDHNQSFNMDKKSRELVMGKLYLKNKDYKMAEKSLLEYLNSSPEDFQALKLLAQVYEYIKDNSKAFDLYERCYLAQPERKGVLLDICRLLLLNDTRLDHVDQRKWLKLAIQTFPSNPIVMNLRDTLPINDYDPTPNKVTIENEIIDKLDRMEQRLLSIENMVADLVKQISIADAMKTVNLSVTPKSVQEPVPSTGSTFGGFAACSGSGKLFADTLKKDNPPSTCNSFGGFAASTVSEKPFVDSPKKDNPPSTFGFAASTCSDNLFAVNIKKENSSSKFGFATPTGSESLFADSQKKDTLPKAGNTSGGFTASSGSGSIFADNQKNESSSSTFGFAAFGGSGNLFADSLKKYNLPSAGPWTIEPKKEEEKEEEDGGDDGDNEVVNSPELPIENTCEMQPIEIKSGEEDEDIVFEYRCKLFRFRDKEYKERGLGNIKVLKHRTTGAGRLIMRRDLINLVCLNCWSCSKIERVRDTQVRFAGLDASDGEPEMTVFLAKFKTQEMTDKFITQITELFPDDS